MDDLTEDDMNTDILITPFLRAFFDPQRWGQRGYKVGAKLGPIWPLHSNDNLIARGHIRVTSPQMISDIWPRR